MNLHVLAPSVLIIITRTDVNVHFKNKLEWIWSLCTMCKFVQGVQMIAQAELNVQLEKKVKIELKKRKRLKTWTKSSKIGTIRYQLQISGRKVQMNAVY